MSRGIGGPCIIHKVLTCPLIILTLGVFILMLNTFLLYLTGVMGKFFGHMMILLAAVVVGYGGAAVITVLFTDSGIEGWQAYISMMGSSLLLGAVFVGLGYLVSVLVRERSTAAGAAIVLWLVLVVLYDLVLLGLLLADHEQKIGQTLFSTLMLVSPADTYRLLNLTAFDAVGQAAGIAGVAARSGFGISLLLGLMVTWVVLPLAATMAVFHRREL